MDEAAKIEAIPPNQLHTVWKFVRRGLEWIIAKTKPDFLPEDVYAQVAHRKAALYVISKEVPLGFAIAFIQDRAYGPKKDLCIWCGWSLPVGELLDLGVSQQEAATIEAQLFAYMKRIAVEMEVASIVYYSRRPGMKKRAVQWGFKPRLVQYELELT